LADQPASVPATSRGTSQGLPGSRPVWPAWIYLRVLEFPAAHHPNRGISQPHWPGTTPASVARFAFSAAASSSFTFSGTYDIASPRSTGEVVMEFESYPSMSHAKPSKTHGFPRVRGRAPESEQRGTEPPSPWIRRGAAAMRESICRDHKDEGRAHPRGSVGGRRPALCISRQADACTTSRWRDRAGSCRRPRRACPGCFMEACGSCGRFFLSGEDLAEDAVARR